jgi:general secretion pathway protein L
MSVLVIQLPPRDRLGARAAGTEASAGLRLPSEWPFVFSADGRSVVQQGSAPLALLPKADETLLLLADADLSWHQINVPKAPAARLRAALVGVMEEALLDDDDALHFALAPDAAPGRRGWVVVTHRAHLAAALQALDAAGHNVVRVLPGPLPVAAGSPARGHFHSGGDPAGDQAWLSLAREDGVLNLRLAGALARALQPLETGTRWTTSPAAAVAAERWLGAPVALLSDAEWALEATRGSANLLQFDLAPRRRGTRALRDLTQRFFSREWRAVRWGLAALLLLQLVGLNAYAWQQRQKLVAKRQAMTELLLSAHPGVRAVLDAPLQMERETERLRAAAGKPGDGDLESLLAAAAGAWPDGAPPVQGLRFEPGKLSMVAPGWGQPQLLQFKDRLRSAGLGAEQADGRLNVTRLAGRGTP